MRAQRRQGRRRVGGRHYISDINVTPFVDVMLVLLIVFMVTAPLLAVGVSVNLPEAGEQPLGEASAPLVVSINRSGDIYLQETEVQEAALGDRLRSIRGIRNDTMIFLRADRNLPYARVMAVMASVQQAGFTRVALVTETPTQK